MESGKVPDYLRNPLPVYIGIVLHTTQSTYGEPRLSHCSLSLEKKKCSVNLLAMYNSQLSRVYRMQCRKTYLKPFSQTFSWQTSVKTSLQSFVCLVMVIHFSLLLAQIHCRCKIQNKMSHKGSSLTLLLIHEHSLNGIMTATAVS